jgi:hypothetical protein
MYPEPGDEAPQGCDAFVEALDVLDPPGTYISSIALI